MLSAPSSQISYIQWCVVMIWYDLTQSRLECFHYILCMNINAQQKWMSGQLSLPSWHSEYIYIYIYIYIYKINECEMWHIQRAHVKYGYEIFTCMREVSDIHNFLPLRYSSTCAHICCWHWWAVYSEMAKGVFLWPVLRLHDDSFLSGRQGGGVGFLRRWPLWCTNRCISARSGSELWMCVFIWTDMACTCGTLPWKQRAKKTKLSFWN